MRPRMRVSLYVCVSLALLWQLSVAWQGYSNAQGNTRAYLPLVLGGNALVAPTPNPTPNPTPTPSEGWLAYVNKLRALAGLPAVTEDLTLSDGDKKHAIYMVKNDVISHEEVEGTPFYTPEGNEAAGKSNVMVSSGKNTSDEDAIDLWMTGPFHAIGILDPRLQQAGFGSYRESGGSFAMGAAMNVISGIGDLPNGTQFPILWPGDGATSWLTTYGGNEAPDPLANCGGYNDPTGAPVYMLFGEKNPTPQVLASSLQRDGTPLQHCVFTGGTYSNADPGQQALGRSVLSGRGAVVVIPREPLSEGQYAVSVTVDGQTYNWSFRVGPRP